MAGLVPAIHVLLAELPSGKTWMPATSAGMTEQNCHPVQIESTLDVQLVPPFARRAIEARAECFVEIRQVVEAPAVADVGNVQPPLIRVAQRLGAGLEPLGEHPVAERLADLLEAQMQRADRHAEMVRDPLRRQIGVVQVVSAE